MHRRQTVMRPARLSMDIIRVPDEQLPLAPAPPALIDDYSDIVLPPRPPTPSIVLRTKRLPEQRHRTAL